MLRCIAPAGTPTQAIAAQLTAAASQHDLPLNTSDSASWRAGKRDSGVAPASVAVLRTQGCGSIGSQQVSGLERSVITILEASVPYFLAWHPERHTAGQLFPRAAGGYATRAEALRHGEALGRDVNWTVLEADDRKRALRLAGTLRGRPGTGSRPTV